MKHVYWISALLMILGCAGYDPGLHFEQSNLSKIQIGMSVKQVESIMGTEAFMFRGDTFGRPMRVDRFSSKDGKQISVFYYRSSVKRADNATSDDETTAVVFVDGKVDAIMAGDFAKSSIEIRFR